MHIAFLGVRRSVGTSANMAALAAGLAHYCSISAVIGPNADFLTQKDAVLLTDCANLENAKEIVDSCDLLALNLSIPQKGLERLYVRYSFVRKNVIFLVGKYFRDKPNELKRLAGQYRISASRVCAIPYDPHFQRAYEARKVMEYVKGLDRAEGGYQDVFFREHLKTVANAVKTYVNRKGEIYYG